MSERKIREMPRIVEKREIHCQAIFFCVKSIYSIEFFSKEVNLTEFLLLISFYSNYQRFFREINLLDLFEHCFLEDFSE